MSQLHVKGMTSYIKYLTNGMFNNNSKYDMFMWYYGRFTQI